MALLQGSGYKLEIPITDCDGKVVVTADMVTEGSFTFKSENGKIVKRYFKDGGGEITFNADKGVWVVPLTERETFAFEEMVEWQARFMFLDGMPDGTVPCVEYLYDSIDRTEFTDGGGADA